MRHLRAYYSNTQHSAPSINNEISGARMVVKTTASLGDIIINIALMIQCDSFKFRFNRNIQQKDPNSELRFLILYFTSRSKNGNEFW